MFPLFDALWRCGQQTAAQVYSLATNIAKATKSYTV